MDDDILKELVHRGVNTFSMRSGLSTSDFGWGSPTFHKMVRWHVPQPPCFLPPPPPLLPISRTPFCLPTLKPLNWERQTATVQQGHPHTR